MRWDWAETSERTAAAWSEVSAAFFDVFESARMAGNSQWVRHGALVGIEAAERGLRLDPEHEACKRELALALVSLALQDFDDRLFELARTRLARARGLREWLSARAPNSLRTTLDLLSVQQKETSVLSELGQYEAAERALLGLRPLVARAVALDPDVVSTRMLEVVLYARLAHNALKGHQAQKALGYAKREVLLAEGIVNRATTAVLPWRQLQLGYNRAASAALSAGEGAIAKDYNAKSAEVCERFLAKQPDNEEWRNGRATVRVRGAEIALASGDMELAQRQLTASLEDWDFVVARNKEDLEAVACRARVLALRGDVFLRKGDAVAALADGVAAHKAMLRIPAKQLEADTLLEEYAIQAELTYGAALGASGESGRARVHLGAAVMRATKLHAREPDNLDAASLRAMAQGREGVSLSRAGEGARGRAALEIALSALRALARKHRRDPMLQLAIGDLERALRQLKSS